MKKVSLLLLFALAITGISFGQLGTASVTYTDGDIETDKYFYNTYGNSTCPGLMTVTLPADALILYTDVSYDMTSDENSSMNKQKSQLRCVTEGGTNETSISSGPSIYTPGTHSYSRTVDIANGITGGGDINFELHAGATHYVHHCSTDSAKVDNNTWTITITYIPLGFPMQALNPAPADGGNYVGIDDDLAWDFGADTESYDVYFGTDNPPTTKLVDNAAAGASGTFDPGTMDETQTYYWQIVSRNANGYTSGSVWSFITVCGSFTTPFTEDFESVTTPELPYCWSGIVNSTSTSATVQTKNYGGNIAPTCVRLYSANDVDATIIFISPQIDVNGGSLADKMVHFYAKGDSYPNFSVGTMSDPTDESTFTAYETFFVWTDYKEYDIYLNDYAGTDTYIAFRLEPNATYQSAYIDDITIKEMPTCLRPTDLSADNLTITSATLSWNDANGATSWNIEWGEAGFTPTGTPTISGVSNPYELTGLTSATEYEFYVQTDCGGGDLSEWSIPATFATPCDFYEVPFSEDFNDVGFGEMPACWSSILLTADGFAMNGVISNDFQMSNGNDANSTLMLISPPILDLAPNRIKFSAKSNKENYDLIIGTMGNPANQNTFDSLTSVTITASYTFEEFDVWLNGYTGTDQYFVIRHSNGTTGLTFNVDDIFVEALPTCLPPVDLFVSDITITTANFNWSESGTAADWEIETGAMGFEPGTGNFINQYFYNNPGSTDLVYELPGLTAATVYDVYVRTDCGGGDFSPWTGPVTFLTGFDAFGVLPVTEDFESGLGITGNNYINTVDWAINTELQHGGLNSVHNMYTENNDNVLFMLGTFDFTAKTDVMLSFWQIAKTDGNSDLCYVEISTDGGMGYTQLPEPTYAGTGNYHLGGSAAEGPHFDEDSYPEWGTGLEVPDSSWWRKEYFNLTDYNMFDNVVIRFRLVSNGYTNKAGWFIDDIAVEALGVPVLSISPLNIDEEVSAGMPVANVDLAVENTGNFPAGFTATVVFDEVDLINENFNSGMPLDWTVVSRGTSEVTWTDIASIFNRNIDGTPMAWADGLQGYAPVELTMDEDLISPTVDASAYAAGILQLEFDQVFDADYQPGDTARVYVYDGANWVMIYEATTDDGSIYSGGVHKVYDVSAYANENFQVKFNYIEGPLKRGRYFAIDNVRLRASMSALDWLSVDGMAATSGVSMPGDGAVVDVELNGTGFEYGTYTANIEVVTDEPGKQLTIVPVTMTVVPIAPPTDLAAMADMSTINLTYNLNDAGDDVIISTNNVDVFDQPENGMVYPVGEMIGANGTVIYQGSMTEFNHADLLPNTTYYYKAWSVANTSIYSVEAATANATTGDYQLVCLPAGWSGVSSYKVPENPALENVLSGIANEMEIMLSNTGFYWPTQNINNIGNWDTQKGYKIKMNEQGCFTVVGDMLEDKTITLTTGADYIPVLCDQPVSANEIFSQFGNSLQFAFDIQTQLVYWPQGGIFTLEMLEPGVGYLVNMNQPGEATFECGVLDNMNYVKAQKQIFEHAPWVYTETGNQHLISINKSAFADLEKGDFIGVFNGQGTCAGFTQYNGETGNLLLVAYSDDFTTDAIDGLQEGENMTFRVFSQSQMLESEVAVQFDASMPNSGSFVDMGLSMILKMGEGATAIHENGKPNISIYPNPATDMVYINLNNVDYTEATVVVYDTKGRAVINQVFNGQAELNVSSLEAGIYFVKINTDTLSEIRKLVIK